MNQSHFIRAYKTKGMIAFAVILALAYLYGVLSPQHYAPSVLDLYIGLGMTLALSVGLLIAIPQIKITYISHTSIVCLFFAVLVALQPLLSTIDYSDSLLFPIAILLLMACLSLVIANLQNKSVILITLVASIYIGGMLTVCTQILQLLPLSYPAWLESLIFYGTNRSRPYGNVGQPNQAAYIIAMAVVAAGFGFLKLKTQSGLSSVLLITVLTVSIVFLGTGQGLSSSRGGLILSIVACLRMFVLYQTSLKQKLLASGFFLALLAIGNWAGTALLLRYAEFKESALDRVVSTDTSRPVRWYLQEQAWLTFSTDWLTGAGWGNLPKVALAYAESLSYFGFATHTHFLPSHIAAELGIIGLLGLVGLGFVILKGLIRSNHTIETKVVSIIIILSLLYSGSEYPFWYIRFLFLFVVLVALIDTSTIKLKLNIKPIVIIYLIALLLGSGFYMHSYRQYVAVDNLIKRSDVEDFESEILVYNLPNIYGFSKFKEVMVFKVISINTDNFQSSIYIGNRVVTNYLDPTLMKKQAALLALDTQNQESLRLYKAACLFNFSKDCEQVKNELQSLSNSQADIFSNINNEFRRWHTDIEN